MEKVSPAKTWIESAFSARRAKNPSYSLRAFAKYLKIPSGRLSEILSGKRNIGAKLATKILKKLDLTPEEETQFLNSLRHQSQDLHESNYHQLNMDAFHIISDWYHYAILSLIKTKNFENDPSWIANRLGISVVEVRAALERLQRLELIELKNEKMVRTKASLTTTHDVHSNALKRSHKQSLEQAIIAIDEVDLAFRDITSMTMAINFKKIPLAKEKIKRFRRELASLLEAGAKTEVYNLNIQLVPLSKITGDS